MKIFIKLSLFVLSLIVFKASYSQQLQLDSIKIKAIDRYLTYFSNENPGAVLSVLKKGQIIYTKAYGMSDISKKDIMTENKAFGIGEISKAFTSIAILQLMEKNKLNITDDLKSIFPDLPYFCSKIKVENLINHTSGLKSYDNANVKTKEQVYNFILNQSETLFEAGTKWQYSNTDYALLALIIEKKSGMIYQDYIRKKVLKKLLMNETFFSNELKGKNLANGHFKEGNEYIVKNQPSSIFGELGIYCSIQDFAKWESSLYTDKLLKCENLAKIFNFDGITYDGRMSHYNFGWQIMQRNGIRYFWIGGNAEGYSSILFHLPHSKMTVVFLANRNDGYDFLKIALNVIRLFDQSIMYKL